MLMPGMDGLDLAAKIHALRPSLPPCSRRR
jgi:hypothetical protein